MVTTSVAVDLDTMFCSHPPFPLTSYTTQRKSNKKMQVRHFGSSGLKQKSGRFCPFDSIAPFLVERTNSEHRYSPLDALHAPRRFHLRHLRTYNVHYLKCYTGSQHNVNSVFSVTFLGLVNTYIWKNSNKQTIKGINIFINN